MQMNPIKIVRKAKEKYQENKALWGSAYYGAQKNVAEIYIERFDYYRKYSPWAILVLLIWFGFGQEWVGFFVTLSFLHLHILFNQLWWKLRNLEFYYIIKEEAKKLSQSPDSEIQELEDEVKKAG